MAVERVINTVSDYLGRGFLRSKLGLSTGYIEQLRVAVRQFDAWRGSPIGLRELSADLLIDFLRAYSRDYAAVTVNNKRRMILHLWQSAAKASLCDLPPDDIPKMPEPQRLPEAWTHAEVLRLMARARSLPGSVGDIPRCYWWSSLLAAIFATACRVTSLRQTKSSDCNLGERYLIIRAESDKSNCDRLKHLTVDAVAEIASLYDAGRKLVWPWPYGKRYFWRYLRNQIVEKADVPSHTRGMDLSHKLRRSSISYTAARGDLDLARQQAGHTDARLTQARYIDPRIASTRNPADVLPSLK